MDNKKYIRLLRPVRPIKFNALIVYSYLFSRPRKKGYSQRFLARYLGLAVNTVASIRDQLLGLNLISLTPRRRLKCIDPPDEMFQRTKCNHPAYTKVFLPAASCPLTTKQNAVYWCWSLSKDRGRCLGPRTIARYLGISRNCAKTALKKVQTYKPTPAHYQDAPTKTAAQTKVQGIARTLFAAGYTEAQILEVMAMADHDEVLVARLFKAAEAENHFDQFETSFNMLLYKLKVHRARPVPEQPTTLEELENRIPADPLTFISAGDTFDHSWFSGRVQGFTSIEYRRWLNQHSQDVLLEALREIIHQQPVSVIDFEQRLHSHVHNGNGKV